MTICSAPHMLRQTRRPVEARVVGHVAMNTSFRASLNSIAFAGCEVHASREAPDVSARLTYAMPFVGLLGLRRRGCSAATGRWAAGVRPSVKSNDPGNRHRLGASALHGTWLYPLRDLMGFGRLVLQFHRRREIVWRNERYRLVAEWDVDRIQDYETRRYEDVI